MTKNIKIAGFVIKIKTLKSNSNANIGVSVFKDTNLRDPEFGTITSSVLKAEQFAVNRIYETIK